MKSNWQQISRYGFHEVLTGSKYQGMDGYFCNNVYPKKKAWVFSTQKQNNNSSEVVNLSHLELSNYRI